MIPWDKHHQEAISPMKTIHIDELKDEKVLEQVSSVIAEGRLVCLPFNSSYRIVANLTDAKAVTRLFNQKNAHQKHPLWYLCRTEKC